jgi:hypothetical protein
MIAFPTENAIAGCPIIAPVMVGEKGPEKVLPAAEFRQPRWFGDGAAG